MLNNFKTYLEKIQVTPLSWLAGISGVLMIRFFLESFSNPSSSGFFASDASTLVHYYLFFLAVAVVFMIFLQLVIPSWKKVIPQLTAISFFGGNLYTGVTLGIRIEIVLMLLFIGLLVYFIEKSWFRAIVSVISLYILIFIFLSLPGVMNAIGGQDMAGNYFKEPLTFIQKSIENSATISNNLHNSLEFSSFVRLFEIAFNFLIGKVFFLILTVATFVWFRLNFKEKLRAVIKNSRPERVTHYFLMIFVGLFAAYSIFPNIRLNWNDSLSVIVLCLSFYFSWMFAVSTNDIVDEEIDAVSDPTRPLIANSLSKKDMKESATIFHIFFA